MEKPAVSRLPEKKKKKSNTRMIWSKNKPSAELLEEWAKFWLCKKTS